jgi:isoleucyl-tRNA synthetase
MSFSDREREILKYWEMINAFERSNQLSRGRKEFSFYDGPPFATGLPHYGHILSGTIKDTVTRFFYQQGYRVERRFGWDCHGLPVEYEIDKLHGIKAKEDVEKVGVAQYNRYCRDIVMRYSGEWEAIVKRMGRWIDFRNGYKTMDFSFMESVWSVFKQLYEKGLVYKGYKVMPYSTKCRTPMSNFEANQNYRDVSDYFATAMLPLSVPFAHRGASYEGVSLLVWTTTPWTLPSNLAVLVNPSIVYALVESDKGLVIRSKASHLASLPQSGGTQEKSRKRGGETGNDEGKSKGPQEGEEKGVSAERILAEFPGEALLGLEYLQPFECFESHRKRGFFRVYGAGHVEETAGTALVHCAPGFGEEDYSACVSNGLIEMNEHVPCPVDEAGQFTDEVKEFAGRHVKECDKDVIAYLKESGRLFSCGSLFHSYPFCWRSDTPLIYKAVPSWFVRVKDSVEKLLSENKKINWSPGFVGETKFGDWLANARDWSISRNRYWGTPIPVWVPENGKGEILVFGSAEELAQESGVEVRDLHKDVVDEIVVVKNGMTYRRTEEVLDCWFESGSVPYAQKHYPFENKESFEKSFPADFIAEGLDQTRGWFYTLHVLSVLLRGSLSFKNVMVTGLVLASDGKKMSKRLKNYPDPVEIMETYGADALRLYLISSTAVKAENLRFTEDGVKEVVRELLIPWNSCLQFYLDTSSLASGDEVFEIEDIAQGISGGRDVLDGWIVRELLCFSKGIVDEVSSYKINGIVQRSIAFVNGLSRWYIRLSRERLRGSRMEVLRTVLNSLAVILSPFAPFFSEYCYQQTRPGGLEMDFSKMSLGSGIGAGGGGSREEEKLSSHFILHSTVVAELTALLKNIVGDNEKTVEQFSRVRGVIEAVRIIREQHSIPLRMPLREVRIVSLDKDENDPAIEEILARESNILKISYCSHDEYIWEEKMVPDFRAIKRNRGPEKVGQCSEAVKKLRENEIKKLIQEGKVSVDGVVIKREDVVYRREIVGIPAEMKAVPVAGSDLYIIADVGRDSHVEELWLRRELKSAVQQLRKRAHLKITDLALLTLSGADPSEVVCDKNTFAVAGEISGVSEVVSVGKRRVTLTLAKKK